MTAQGPVTGQSAVTAQGTVTDQTAASPLAYLGPEGTFTHQAAINWLGRASALRGQGDYQPCAVDTVGQVFAQVSDGRSDFGVIALESSIEGHVTPSIDGLLLSQDVMAVDEVVLPISFDAFARDVGPYTQGLAHPYGLAQVTGFMTQHHLAPVPTSSNAAACRDLGPGQVAFGPSMCGDLYRLRRLARGVEDYPGAKTRFAVLTRRSLACAAYGVLGQGRQVYEPGQQGCEQGSAGSGEFAGPGQLADCGPLAGPGGNAASLRGGGLAWRTMVAVTPTHIGPGVLARVTSAFGRQEVNMSSLVSRPLKARAQQYAFIVTCDFAPWQAPLQAVLRHLMQAGDAVKTLGVYRAQAGDDTVDSVLASHIPPGSVTDQHKAHEQQESLLW